MKTKSSRNFGGIFFLSLLAPLLLAVSLVSCTKEEPVIVTPDNSTESKFLFGYRRNGQNSAYRSFDLTSRCGSEMASYVNNSDFGGWSTMAGIEAGKARFVFGHNWGGTSYNKEFTIRPVLSNGDWGDAIQTGDWAGNYETVFGFKLGERGFLFGQDSHGDHHWFVQEIYGNGYLASDESDNGNWNNFYETATPFYVNGKTYLFFQTSKSDHYWFIAYVSDKGQLYDVCDGYWGYLWESVTSVEVDGKTYLVGCRNTHSMTDHTEWFVQAINSDGSMGAETARGTWSDYYNHLVGYSYGGKAYIYGYNNALTDGGNWFTQEITSDGKMGTETSSGNIESDFLFFYPFNQYDPGSFRYMIGWDLSAGTGAPARSWSSLFIDPWTTATRFAGGAALADIDRDGGARLDALLLGIEDIAGGDRFYYKVSWNLDGTGKAAGWSQAFRGPVIGQMQSGGGADIADIDRNGIPDLLVMVVDNPENGNSFWYNIGWDIGANGQVSRWSETIQVGGLGFDNAGGGVALGDIDKNGQTDAVFVAIDNPDQGNTFWYAVGQNFAANGKATAWTNHISAPCNLGWSTAGGGAALADINGNGKPDLVLTGIDSPSGANNFWCYVGWDIDINGNVTGWSPKFVSPSPGNMTIGGGTAVGDIDKNGIPDILLMSVDDPYGKD
jgi:hypothetical protein